MGSPRQKELSKFLTKELSSFGYDVKIQKFISRTPNLKNPLVVGMRPST